MNLSIEVKQLTKRYKTQKEGQFAIKNINLEIPSGQLFCLVGPDGAGKTTTLRLLATVLRPTSGKAKIDGFDAVRDAEKVRSCIGYMAQSYGLYPDLSVRENLDFFADLKGVLPNEKSEKIQDLMEFARLTNFFNRRSEHLSGGMQKKLALCCALINDPDLLILDEPTATLTPREAQGLFTALRSMADKQMGVIFITHKLNEIRAITNRVVIMRHGQVIASRKNDATTSQKMLAELNRSQLMNQKRKLNK